jgi:hypothetical protein
MIPAAYRPLLRDRRTRRLLTGLGVSSLGDGMSVVTIAWLAVRVAPAGRLGLFVGLAVAAYMLPGVVGAVAFGGILRHRPARALVLMHCVLRTGFLGVVALLWAAGAEQGGPEGRLAANSLATAQVSLAVIVGPSIAGVLMGWIGPGWLIALDAASFAFLGIQAWRTPTGVAEADRPVDPHAAESGFRVLSRRRDLLSLTVLTWLFFFLYGPVEDALPVYVATDLHASASLLGVYWTAFGVGALVASLVTGTLRARNMRRVTVLIVAGWGACLVPFAFAPVGVTLACFALGGMIYGPFIPLTYAQFQSATTTANLPAVLAARSALIMVSSPLGTALGGPLVAALGAAETLAVSGTATVMLAAAAAVLWHPERTHQDLGPEGIPH